MNIWLKMLWVMTFSVSLTLSTAVGAMEKDAPVEQGQAFVLGKGINLAHWLSQTKRKGAERRAFLNEKDIEQIGELGFDHIRMPIDEKEMWSEDGVRDEDAFATLHDSIRWALKNDLKVVVDLHILRSHYFNAKDKPLWYDAGAQETFFQLWRDLSDALQEYPTDKVAYELMNEPVADNHEDWNNLIAKVFKVIRDLEPKRWVVIGSNMWQGAHTFDELRVPNDRRIILSFHFYEPFLLSHYKTSWNPIKVYEGPVHYPGAILSKDELAKVNPEGMEVAKEWVDRKFNREILVKMMEKPLKKSEELGLPLYCGEYGIFYTAPEEDRLRWFNDIASIFDEYGISSAAWNYKSDQFGIVNNDASLNKEMIAAIKGQ